VLSWLPLFKRVDSHAVRFTAHDMAEAYRTMEFLTTYGFDLEP
jgi:D-aminopeptidase